MEDGFGMKVKRINPTQRAVPFLILAFDVFGNGRKYQNWRWQPEGCGLPRFNASELLERSRNGGIVFAGDSVGRNQWEPFLCMLAQGVSNKAPFLVTHRLSPTTYTGSPKNGKGLMFWWSTPGIGGMKDKTVKMGYYFEDKGKVTVSLNVMEAFKKSLQTPKLWIENLNPERTRVFFRGYSPVHYRQPLTNYTMLEPEPVHNQIISTVIKEMDYGDRKVQFLNITHLTRFSYDGHPSRHREPGTPVDAP
ncbi:hypothetical protein Peur_045753 [Populus x canadensis]